METAAWMFLPPAAPRVGDLYGASGGARVGEPLALALEMDQLEREERAFAASVQALVRRPAPEPIGVKFHRPGGVGGRFTTDARGSRGSSLGAGPGRGSPFPPSQFAVDESSTDSVGLHERVDGEDDDVEEEEEEEEGEEEEEDMDEDEDEDEDETDEDDVFTAEEDHDEEDEVDAADPFDRGLDRLEPERRAADVSTPLDAAVRPAPHW